MSWRPFFLPARAARPNMTEPSLSASRNGLQAIGPLMAIAGFVKFAGLGYEIVCDAAVLPPMRWATKSLLCSAYWRPCSLRPRGWVAAALGPAHCLWRRKPAIRAGTPALELAIGAMGDCPHSALVPALIDALVPDFDARSMHRPCVSGLVAFTLPSHHALLPATLAMGATLPALEAILRPSLASGRAVGWVYAANTFGAVAGHDRHDIPVIIPAHRPRQQTLVLCAVSQRSLCAGYGNVSAALRKRAGAIV